MPDIENRIELASDKDEFGMPLGKIIHSFDQDAVALWNANFEEGLKVAKATGAKDVWSGRGNMPTIHLFGGTIMARSGNSVTTATARPTRSEPLRGGPGIFPTEGARIRPTHLRAVAARRRASGRAVGSVAG